MTTQIKFYSNSFLSKGELVKDIWIEIHFPKTKQLAESFITRPARDVDKKTYPKEWKKFLEVFCTQILLENTVMEIEK